MIENSCYARQGFKQSYLLVAKQISASPLKDLMLQQVHPDVDIASQDIWILITLAIKNIVMGIWNSLLNRHLKRLLTLYHSFTITSLAFILLTEDVPSS